MARHYVLSTRFMSAGSLAKNGHTTIQITLWPYSQGNFNYSRNLFGGVMYRHMQQYPVFVSRPPLNTTKTGCPQSSQIKLINPAVRKIINLIPVMIKHCYFTKDRTAVLGCMARHCVLAARFKSRILKGNKGHGFGLMHL